MSVPRPSWSPASYADAVDDATNGRVFEHHYLELKTEYKANQNAEMAGDIASLANDSGLLVVGVDEDKATGMSTAPTPFVLKGFIERVEQVARSLDPPLNVECQSLADPVDPVVGMVLIRVPASALAPHQANKRYYGRNERSTYKLSDAEVEALMRRRGIRADRINAALDYPPGFGWVNGSSIGRFAAVVEPAAGHNAELLADQLASAEFATWLDTMVAEAGQGLNSLVSADASLAEFVWPEWSPFEATRGWGNVRTGTGVARRSGVVPNDSPYRTAWLGVDESGATSLAMDHMVFAEPNVMPVRMVFDWQTMVASTAWLVMLSRAVCGSVGLSTPFSVGVRAVGMSAAFPVDLQSGSSLAAVQARPVRAAWQSDEHRGLGTLPMTLLWSRCGPVFIQRLARCCVALGWAICSGRREVGRVTSQCAMLVLRPRRSLSFRRPCCSDGTDAYFGDVGITATRMTWPPSATSIESVDRPVSLGRLPGASPNRPRLSPIHT